MKTTGGSQSFCFREMPGFLGKLARGLEWIGNQLGWIAGGLTLVMMVAQIREVVGRHFFNTPSDWSLELCGYLLVGLAYLSAPFTEIHDGHIRIDFFYERLGGLRKKVVDIFILLIGLTWAVIVCWQGGRIALHSLETGACSSDAMMWPLFPSQVVIPIGAGLLALVVVAKVVRDLYRLSGKWGA
ncbi:MAG: TRAP transporter small permease subunit [Desulfarculaceae bacterium]|jgi:TRAP-type mannitol/chloroaromatic compound transport system permease small subunit